MTNRVRIQTVEEDGTTGQVFVRDTASATGGAWGAVPAAGGVTGTGTAPLLAYFNTSTGITSIPGLSYDAATKALSFSPTSPTTEPFTITATLPSGHDGFFVNTTGPGTGACAGAAAFIHSEGGSSATGVVAAYAAVTGAYSGVFSTAMQFDNTAPGTGAHPGDSGALLANWGTFMGALGTTSTGWNIGGGGRGYGSDVASAGLWGDASDAGGGTHNGMLLGVVGHSSQRQGGTGYKVGGYFYIGGIGNPTTGEEVAIVGDDQTGGSHKLLSLRTMGTEGFAVGAGGDIIKTRGVTTSWPASNAAGVLTNDGAGSFSWVAAPPPGGAAGGDLAGTYPNPTFNPAVVTTFAKTMLDDATASDVRTTLGLGSAATTSSADYDAAGAAAAAQAASQPLDADLTAIAALASAADKMPYATGAGAWSLADLTAFARTLLAAADAAAAQAVLGVSSGLSLPQTLRLAGLRA